MSRTRTGALTVQQQRQLARIAERPDIPIAMRVRVKLLNRLEENFELIWQAIEAQLIFGSREQAPATQLLISLLDRLLPTQREVVSATTAYHEMPEEQQRSGVIINIRNVNRGTKGARNEAIEIQAEKREQLKLPAA